jgi:hypothetical protein
LAEVPNATMIGVAQRSEFAGYLRQHGPSAPDLAKHLQKIAAKLSTPPQWQRRSNPVLPPQSSTIRGLQTCPLCGT